MLNWEMKQTRMKVYVSMSADTYQDTTDIVSYLSTVSETPLYVMLGVFFCARRPSILFL